MTPELIRSVWKLIEDFPARERASANSDRLISLMLEALIHRGTVTPENSDLVRDYLNSRMLLIQEF